MHCSSQHTICQRACNCNSEQRFGVPGRCEGMRRVRDVAHSSTTHTHTHTGEPRSRFVDGVDFISGGL